MRYIFLVISVVFVCDLFAAADKGKEKTNVTSIQEKGIKAVSAGSSTAIQKNKIEKYSEITPKHIWVNDVLKSALESQNSQKTLNLDKALQIIHKYIFTADSEVDVGKIFSELRKIFSEKEFGSDQLIEFIDDAVEIKKKYHFVFEFVVRCEYAKRSIEEGVDIDDALAFASSDYIQIPQFVFNADEFNTKLDELITDLGCGIVWKDRLKYMIAYNTYCKKDTELKIQGFEKFPIRIRNYIRLAEENNRYFTDVYKHLSCLIAQDFYYGNISKNQILKIFSFTEKEWDSLIKPIIYN